MGTVATFYCVGTTDTKLEELRFLAETVRSSLATFSSSSSSKVEVVIVDVSAGQKETESLSDFKFVTRNELLLCYSKSVGGNPIVLPDDRGEAVGTGGTSLLSILFRSLPLSVPKLIVSIIASGQTEPYVKTSDLVLFRSIVDICGINNVSKIVLSNPGASFVKSFNEGEKGTVGITMFGVTTPCVNVVSEKLKKEGYETLIFNATGVGGKAMESLVREGYIQVYIY
ncbi:hypothetical protein ES332_A11G206200v1 [Gossypium tomentosum]|uniref:Uncharacterized protein n=1 Tax=Gossypium tomentosum TaxID=34277 RepID=A0A5D2NGY7_GOSTO|nr:hypothetical protein ES332_A11G206200v1 [Gossypium tomentosum]